MLLSDYLGLGSALDENGVFDPILDKDSHFFINVQRLKKATTPEFCESYHRINEYFRKIIKLLDRATIKSNQDIFYRQALKLFDFSEVNGICLGYAENLSGTGFGPVLSKQVIDTAFDIVKAGIQDPEFFELLPLFQENIGPDRLSDMIATIILDDIKAYTRRVNGEFKITQDTYKDLKFHGDFLTNPYKHNDVLLVPIELLHKLPIARSWEEIDCVVFENSTIRAEMNQEVAEEWTKYSAQERKTYLRRTIFQDAEVCKRVLEGYREEELPAYDLKQNLEYFIAKLWQKIRETDIPWKSKYERQDIDSFTAACEILTLFKRWVENNKGWEVIQNANGQNREKILQRIIHLSGISYISTNNLDISCEPNAGRGPVDFKISRGQDKTIIEVKLSSNPQYMHGYEIQVEEYGKAEQTNSLIYVLVDLGNPIRVTRLKNFHDRLIDEEQPTPKLIIIDATPKESATRFSHLAGL